MAPIAVLDRTFDALANEHRRSIVDRLSAGALDTPALGEHFQMSKQALHKHLHVLEQAGLIQRELRGRVHQVQLRADSLDAVTAWVSEIRRGWEASFDRLGQLLEEGDS